MKSFTNDKEDLNFPFLDKTIVKSKVKWKSLFGFSYAQLW